MVSIGHDYLLAAEVTPFEHLQYLKLFEFAAGREARRPRSSNDWGTDLWKQEHFSAGLLAARQTTDPAWPKPVWGVVPAKPYAPETAEAFKARFSAALSWSQSSIPVE